jgi:hypothetical protein
MTARRAGHRASPAVSSQLPDCRSVCGPDSLSGSVLASEGGSLLARAEGPWLLAENEALDSFKPLELIERGETDRIWQLVFALETGMPTWLVGWPENGQVVPSPARSRAARPSARPRHRGVRASRPLNASTGSRRRTIRTSARWARITRPMSV